MTFTPAAAGTPRLYITSAPAVWTVSPAPKRPCSNSSATIGCESTISQAIAGSVATITSRSVDSSVSLKRGRSASAIA